MKVPERLEKYMQEFDEDTKLSMTNIMEKSLMVSSLQAKWLRYYYAEQSLNKKLKDVKYEYSKLAVSKMDFRQPTLPGATVKTETDKKMDILAREEKTVELCLDYIKNCIKVLGDFNYQIKNVIDLAKLERG